MSKALADLMERNLFEVFGQREFRTTRGCDS